MVGKELGCAAATAKSNLRPQFFRCLATAQRIKALRGTTRVHNKTLIKEGPDNCNFTIL
jgi:hypothetical protein